MTKNTGIVDGKNAVKYAKSNTSRIMMVFGCRLYPSRKQESKPGFGLRATA
jgi:hypothetical protein